jgi:hypothetical protein
MTMTETTEDKIIQSIQWSDRTNNIRLYDRNIRY